MSDFRLVKMLDPITVTNVTGGLTPRGFYSGSTTYNVGDEVSYNGSSYVLYAAATAGTLPTDTTKWSVLASKGDAGASGADLHYQATFTSQTTVAVAHNLNKLPAVTILDTSGDECEAAVHHTDANNLTVTFSAANSGTVYCN